MNKILIGIIVVVIVGGGVWYFSEHKSQSARQAADPNAMVSDLGMYPYVCDNGSTFILSPLAGLKTVQVSADAQGMFTGTATLSQTSGTSYQGTAPDGQTVALVADGETIRLTASSKQAICSPKPDPDMAPWNWGDAGMAATSSASAFSTGY